MLPVGLEALRQEVVACRRCPRLAEYLAAGGAAHPDYWSRPVPGYGDPEARLLIVGLAPAFHGGNRHGRVFTGDSSGAWLWRALHALGAASSPVSDSPADPLLARGVYVTNAVRCAPPGNRPTGAEIAACAPFLTRELALLPRVQVVLALGRVAHDACLRLWPEETRRGRRFAHGAVHAFPGRPGWLVDSYHPSRQNTNTGVLTWEMWLQMMTGALQLASGETLGHTRTSRL